jgi:hypothetical protein
LLVTIIQRKSEPSANSVVSMLLTYVSRRSYRPQI